MGEDRRFWGGHEDANQACPAAADGVAAALIGEPGTAAAIARPVSARRQWWLVACLTIVSMLALIDKNLIQLMVTPIRHDLNLSDVQISVLIGSAFAVANIAAGLPAGWLADRVGRRGLIGAGVVVWSVATAISGIAGSFGGLFAARSVVGIGEGIIPPAGYSLIRDGVDLDRRGRALAIYATATLGGAGLALVVCGTLIGAIVSHGINRVPLIGAIHPWQLALVIIGIAGLPVALLLLTLHKVSRVAPVVDDHNSYVDALRFIRARSAVLVPLLIYSIAHSMLMATMGSWVAALIGRKFGLPPARIGTILGMLLIVCGPVGLTVIGLLIDRLYKAGKQGAAIMGVIGAVLFAVAGAVMPQVSTLAAFWPIETVVVLFTTPFLVVTATIISREAPSHMIGKLMAIYLFLQGLAGPAMAPTIAALLSERVFVGRANALGDAITTSAIVYGGLGIVMAALLWRNLSRARTD